MRPHPRRARTDPSAPAAWGTCDRSGFVLNQRDLKWQFEWSGLKLINKRVLVAPDMYDKPNRQLGTIVLPPDPMPIMNARPENYAIDEYPVSALAVSSGAVLVLSGNYAHPIEIIVSVPGNIIDGTI
jgi:hypothetical protein